MDRREWHRSLAPTFALAIASAAGCTRGPEEGRTETTSSDDFIERTRVIDDMFVRGEDNPAAWGTDAAAAEPHRTDGGRAPATDRREDAR